VRLKYRQENGARGKTACVRPPGDAGRHFVIERRPYAPSMPAIAPLAPISGIVESM